MRKAPHECKTSEKVSLTITYCKMCDRFQVTIGHATEKGGIIAYDRLVVLRDLAEFPLHALISKEVSRVVERADARVEQETLDWS